jgi:hypothetical protein
MSEGDKGRGLFILIVGTYLCVRRRRREGGRKGGRERAKEGDDENCVNIGI